MFDYHVTDLKGQEMAKTEDIEERIRKLEKKLYVLGVLFGISGVFSLLAGFYYGSIFVTLGLPAALFLPFVIASAISFVLSYYFST